LRCHVRLKLRGNLRIQIDLLPLGRDRDRQSIPGFVLHPAAQFAPDGGSLAEWLAKNAVADVEDDDVTDAEDIGGQDIGGEEQVVDGDVSDEFADGYRDAAE
jgi:hypothetical protein